MQARTFTVRSRVKIGGKWMSEWTQVVKNEAAVRRTVAAVVDSDAEVRRWSVELELVEHCYADIGGHEERAEQIAELEALGIKGVTL